MFSLYVQVENYQYIFKLRCWPLVFTLCKAFLNNKKRSWISLTASFSTWFLKERISYALFIKWPSFIASLAFFLDILGNICITVICFPVCDVAINFEINLSFFIKSFSYIFNKSGQKCQYLKNVILKRLSDVRNCLRPKSGSLT